MQENGLILEILIEPIKMLNLGIVHKDGKVINHRSLFKVALNPIFRYFGFCVGTLYYNEENPKRLGGLTLLKSPRSRSFKWSPYDMTGCVLEKRRRFI